jgi:hypothetical protein
MSSGRKEAEVRLSLREHTRLSILRAVAERRFSQREAAEKLDLSTRQVRRLQQCLAEQGPSGLVHGNRGRPSNRRINEKKRDELVHLYSDTYDGFNLTHFHDMLISREKMCPPCRETLRKILKGAGVWKARRKAPKHRQRRSRREREGELLQCDASIHPWFGTDRPVCAVVGSIDDATGTVPFALFNEAETTLSYMQMLHGVLTRRGVPKALYTDRDSVFVINTKGGMEQDARLGRARLTQFGRALAELDIDWIPASSPQAKGRIERLWGTFQDRLFHELKLHGIQVIAEANRYLWRHFLPEFNRKFGRLPASSPSAYRLAPPRYPLERILCLREERTLDNDHTFSLDGVLWQVLPTPQIHALARRRIEVRITRAGETQAWYGPVRLRLRPASKSARYIPAIPAALPPELRYPRRARIRL